MSLPKYPEYKDSGVSWLGEVPAHWEVKPLKYLASFSGGGTPSRDSLEYWNGEIPWVSPKDMKQEKVTDAEERITELGVLESSTSLQKPGQALLVVRSGILKHTIPVAINEVFVALNQDMKALDFGDHFLSRFFLRWVQGHNDQLLNVWLKQGATVESIEHQYLAETKFPLPPQDEVVEITEFLDRETTKIDALIAEQEKLIALLAEKRQATISRAVTRGLDPNVPLKDSGVPWLGKVPAHWNALNLSVVLRAIGDIDHYMPETVENGIPYIMTGDLKPLVSQIEFGACKKVAYEDYFSLSRKIKCEKGDVIMARYATIGVASYVDIDSEILVSYSCVIMKPDVQRLIGLYLFYFFKSIAFFQAIAGRVNSNTQGNVGLGDIRKIKLALPSLDEQQKIVENLEKILESYALLEKNAKEAIALARERRAALISAAVTGKIDVRGLPA